MPKIKKTLIIIGLVSAIAFALAMAMRSVYTLPILMYHSISPQATKKTMLAVSPQSFERQMRFLKDRHYNVIPLEEAVRLIKDKKSIPYKTVVITFDDGYKDNYTYALPILKKYRLPATAFIIVNEVGRQQQDRLSWDEIKEMQLSGLITIGSHCLGPEPLVKLPSDDKVKNEIFASKVALEEELGREVKTFSYPEGRFNGKIKALVKQAGYTGAVATNPGKKFPSNDPFALKRLRISSTCDNLFVFFIEASGYYNFMREHRRK